MLLLLEKGARNLARSRQEDRNPSASDEDIPGPHKELARVLRRLFGPAPSHRGISNRTGVNFSTVGTLLQGGTAAREGLEKIGRAYRICPNRLLELAGYDAVPEFDLRAWEGETPELLRAFGWDERPVPDIPVRVRPITPAPPAVIEEGPPKEIVFKTGERIIVEREQGEPLHGEVTPQLAEVVWQIVSMQQPESPSQEGGEELS
jgi:hypothetical protein